MTVSLNRRTGWQWNLVLGLVLSSPGWCLPVAADDSAAPQSTPESPPQPTPQRKSTEVLHVRLLEDGRWIAWMDTRAGRTRVNVPQELKAISELAESKGLTVAWYGVPEADLPKPGTNPAPAPAAAPGTNTAPPTAAPATISDTAAPEWTSTPLPASPPSQSLPATIGTESEPSTRQAPPFPDDLTAATITTAASAPANPPAAAPVAKPPAALEDDFTLPQTNRTVEPLPEVTEVRTASTDAKLPASSATSAPEAPGVPTRSSGAPTAAERLSRLNWTIRTDERRLEELTAELDNPESEFAIAEVAFQELIGRLRRLQRQREQLAEDTADSDREALDREIASVESKRELARQRLDLAIQSQRLLREQIDALQEKLLQERQARARLTGQKPPGSNGNQAAPNPTTTEDVATLNGKTVQSGSTSKEIAPPPPQDSPADAGRNSSGNGAANDVAEAQTKPTFQPDQPPSKELKQAAEKVQATSDAAAEAEDIVQSLTDRIAALDRNIELEQQLYGTAKQRSEIAYQQQHALETEFQALSVRGEVPLDELKELSERVKNAERDFAKARQEFRERADRLQQLQRQRQVLLTEQIAALEAAREKRAAAESAALILSDLKNPFALQNVLQWLLDHGVKIIVILLGMLFLRSMAAVVTQRIVNILVQRGVRGSKEERADRAHTLAGVFHNAASLAITIGGILMMCEEVGIAVGPLMGGAAVLGLAVAFGAQNLIRDYFYGFMILLENQYKINDVLQIGTVSGQVERITLRMTVLRDIEGRVHFIPNGKIETVTNMTHGWSRALFDIRIGFESNADQVMALLLELAAELRLDEKFGPLITDDAEMLGVNSFDDSGVTIRFFIKTKPLKQWAVRRELLRRIKQAFDERGIKIPYPHRTIYHHSAPAEEDDRDQSGEWGLRRSA